MALASPVVRQRASSSRPGKHSRTDPAQGKARRQAFGLLCTLQAGAGLAGSAVTFLYQPHNWSVVGGSVPLDSNGQMLATLLQVAVLLASITIFFVFSGFNAPIYGGIVLLLAIPTFEMLRAVSSGVGVGYQFVSMLYVSLVTLALISLKPRIDDLKIIGLVGVGIALLALAYAALLPANAFMPDGWNEKLIRSLPALAGPFYHSNTLGLLLALCLPFTLLLGHQWVRLSSIALLAITILLSQSRTALLAAGVSILVLAICRVQPRISRQAASLSLLLTGVVIFVIPLATADADDFSDRGRVWQWALRQLNTLGQYTWGVRPQWPITKGEGSLASSAHNLFIQWMFIGGIILILIGAGVFIAFSRQVIPLLPAEPQFVATLYLLTLLLLSMFEFLLVFNPGSPFFLVIVIPLACVLNQRPPNQKILQ